jgi:hypothetical protein
LSFVICLDWTGKWHRTCSWIKICHSTFYFISAPLNRSFIQPSAPPEEPQVRSDFSWDFLYNALQPNADVSHLELFPLIKGFWLNMWNVLYYLSKISLLYWSSSQHMLLGILIFFRWLCKFIHTVMSNMLKYLENLLTW